MTEKVKVSLSLSDILTLEDETNTLSLNFGNLLYATFHKSEDLVYTSNDISRIAIHLY
jgi:hypothetical protein